MTRDTHLNDFIAENDARVERARRAIAELEEAQRRMQLQQDGWAAQLAQLTHLREEDLRGSAMREVRKAQDRPPLPAPEVAVDKATQFARIVRRRRATV